MRDCMDAEGDDDQHEAERDGARRIAAVVFERDDGGERTRGTANVSTENDGGAELGKDTRECQQHTRCECRPHLAEQHAHRRHSPQSQSSDGFDRFEWQTSECHERGGRHDRNGEHKLAHDHRRSRVQQLHPAQRARCG